MNLYLVNVILCMLVATAITRLLPICLPKKYHDSPLLKEMNTIFPILILTLLIIFSVKDINWGDQSTVLAQAVGILLTVVIHLYKRNAFLSIFIGTMSHVILLNMKI